MIDLSKHVRKAASRQLDKALKTLRQRSDSARSRDAAVHTARKRLREVRALLRLVRKGLGTKEFARENKALRNAARPLSEVRDTTALIGALRSLQKRRGETVDNNAFEPARKALERRRSDVRKRILIEGTVLARTAKVVERVRNRVAEWDLGNGGFKDVQFGLRKTYKLGCRAMANASKDPTDEHLHEWRKRTKNLRYQLELLETLWRPAIEALAGQAKTLADRLGDDHDLAVLRGLLAGELKEAVPAEAAHQLTVLIDARRVDLQRSAKSLGQKLFAESPEQFVDRIKACWQTT